MDKTVKFLKYRWYKQFSASDSPLSIKTTRAIKIEDGIQSEARVEIYTDSGVWDVFVAPDWQDEEMARTKVTESEKRKADSDSEHDENRKTKKPKVTVSTGKPSLERYY